MMAGAAVPINDKWANTGDSLDVHGDGRLVQRKKKTSRLSVGAFLIRVRGMYLLAKLKTKDHVSCLANSHLA